MIVWVVVVLLLGAPAAMAQATRGSELAVVDAFFEDADRTLVRQQHLPAGETLYLSFRIAGYRPDAQQRVRLTYWVDCADPQHAPLAETFSEKIEATLAPQDENWRPKISWAVAVPASAPTGEYQVAIRVRDEIAGREVRHQMPFKVRGQAVEPSETLVVRNFEFADAEDGKPKVSATFTRASTLWARFRVVGYRVAPDKQIWVEQDLTVLDGEGKTLYSQPNAALEKYAIFYPPRFLPASFSLDLQPKLKLGEYTIRLDFRDRVGEQKLRYEARFTVKE